MKIPIIFVRLYIHIHEKRGIEFINLSNKFPHNSLLFQSFVCLYIYYFSVVVVKRKHDKVCIRPMKLLKEIEKIKGERFKSNFHLSFNDIYFHWNLSFVVWKLISTILCFFCDD